MSNQWATISGKCSRGYAINTGYYTVARNTGRPVEPRDYLNEVGTHKLDNCSFINLHLLNLPKKKTLMQEFKPAVVVIILIFCFIYTH